MRDLRLVLAIGTAGSTAAAAEVLHLTQSAVSRALAVAEAHAGAALFARTSRGLVATEAGEVVLAQAPDILSDLTALQRRLRDPQPRPRRLRFAAECVMAYPWLARVVLHLQRTTPSIELSMPLDVGDTIVESLADRHLDAAMLTSRPPAGVTSRKLFHDELVFIVGDHHPRAGARHLTRDDLLADTLLASTARAGDRWFLRKVFGKRQAPLRVKRFPVTEAIVEFARAGLGIAVLSEWVANAYLGPGSGLHALPLDSGRLERPWRLSHHKDQAPVADALADAILASRPTPRRQSGPDRSSRRPRHIV